MYIRSKAALAFAVPALAAGLAACGSDDSSSTSSAPASSSGSSGEASGSVNVYSSLPLQGASKDQTNAMVDGIKLAIKQAGNKAGGVSVKYTSLDDSTAQAGNWDPNQVASNARKVAQDKKAVAYIGEFNSGASALSIPILNQVGIAQISPANTYVGLTTDEPGSEKGEPAKYQPTGKKTYTRIVPRDTIQAAALVTQAKNDGCTKIGIANDKDTYGLGLARLIEIKAKEQGVTITANEGIQKDAANFRGVASKIKGAGADCFIFAGVTANGAIQVYKDVSAGPGRLREALRRRRRLRVRVHEPEQEGHPGQRGQELRLHGRDARPRVLPGRQAVHRRLLQGVRQRQARPVRHLRLRGDAARARHHQGGRPGRHHA